MKPWHQIRQVTSRLNWPVTQECFGAFFEETHSWVYAYCLSILHDPEASEEAMQAVYSDIWELLSSRGCALAESSLMSSSCVQKEEVRTGADQMQAVNIRLLGFADLHVDRLRKRFNTHIERHADLDHAMEIPDTTPLPFDLLVQQESASLLFRYLSLVDEELRELLILHFFEGQTHREIAGRMKLDRSSVSRRMQRAIEELQSIMPYALRRIFLQP